MGMSTPRLKTTQLDYATMLDFQLAELKRSHRLLDVRRGAERELERRRDERESLDAQIGELVRQAGFDCATARNVDALDFKHIHVDTMSRLLTAAFHAGQRSTRGAK